jgi:hypothetical protein
MYKLKPLQENIEITHKPTCMYAMKNLYENDKSEDLKVVKFYLQLAIFLNIR